MASALWEGYSASDTHVLKLLTTHSPVQIPRLLSDRTAPAGQGRVKAAVKDLGRHCEDFMSEPFSKPFGNWIPLVFSIYHKTTESTSDLDRI